ncbi:hypothetical protein Daus18300_007260 [Diaporthe australafricana]|uniref:Uncharacterized protein n=1 Tax=Diaporthe australafricana TaxID=127596 RepID=A0ABR3WP84_9PEZI
MIPFTIKSVVAGMLSHPNNPDLYRIRVQPADVTSGEPTIKYLTAPNTSQVFTGPDAHARRRNNLAFDNVPAGDWVVGRLVAAEEGKLELASTETDTEAALDALGLRSAEPVWCDTFVDEQDCQDEVDNPDWPDVVVTVDGKEISVPKPTDLQCMDYVSASVITTPPGAVTAAAGATQVVRVSDWIPGHWVGVEADARAHEIIEARDPGLAPRVVAHVTENHARVVGFLLERVPGAREAGAEDLDACRAALGRLHALGIAKGELSRHSFLVREDGSVLIQGPFTGCFVGEGNIEEAMRAEMASLEDVLGRSPSVFEDQAASMLRLVDPQRMRLLEEFQTAHGFVVPFVYWQDSREGGRRITLTVEQHGVLAEEYKKNGFRWTAELQEQAEKRFGPSVEAI